MLPLRRRNTEPEADQMFLGARCQLQLSRAALKQDHQFREFQRKSAQTSGIRPFLHSSLPVKTTLLLSSLFHRKHSPYIFTHSIFMRIYIYKADVREKVTFSLRPRDKLASKSRKQAKTTDLRLNRPSERNDWMA